MIRVLVIAATQALRAGIQALLESGEGLQVIAQVSHLNELGAFPPDTDVLVTTSVSGLRAGLERLSEGETVYPSVLLLTDETRQVSALRSLPSRAWGVLPLDASQEELVAGVHALSEGLSVAPPDLLELALEDQPLAQGTAEQALIEPLTQRESEVLELVAQGLANKQIALELDISEHTVKFHVSSIYAKLGATNRTEAVRMGLQYGLIVL